MLRDNAKFCMSYQYLLVQIIAAMRITKSLLDAYYWLFPGELEKKRDMEKLEALARESARRTKAERKRDRRARLLLEYDELLARRDELVEELSRDVDALLKFYDLLYALKEGGYDDDLAKRGERSGIASFDLSELPDYGEAKARGMEYEQVIIKIFILKRKLGLLHLDYGIVEREHDER